MQGEESEKVLYTPSEEHRFVVSPDQYSQSRMRVIKEAYREMCEKLPSITTAIVVGGSLVKGKVLTAETAGKSDIDLATFYDEDEALKQADTIALENSDFNVLLQNAIQAKRKLYEMNREEPDEQWFKNAGIHTAMQEHIRDILMKNLRERASDCGFTAVSERKWTNGAVDPSPIEMEGQHSIMNGFLRYKASLHALYVENSGGDTAFAKFFLYDIGGSLKKYRQEFLKQLAAMGKDNAESNWRIAIQAMQELERYGHIPDNLKNEYPQTFAEACKYYSFMPVYPLEHKDSME